MKKDLGKAAPTALLIVTVGACIVRFFQYVSIVDFNTGFYTRGSEAAALLVYIVLVLGFAVYAVLSFMAKKQESPAFNTAFSQLSDTARRLLGGSYVAAGIIKGLGVSFDNFDLLQIGGLAAAAALAAAGGVIIGGGKASVIAGYLQIIPAVYYFFASAVLFNSDLIIINHSDNLIVLLSLIAVTMLWASLARFFSDTERSKSRIRELLTAGACLALILLHILPKLMAFCFGGDAVNGMDGISADAAAGLLPSLCFIFVIFFGKKTEAQPD